MNTLHVRGLTDDEYVHLKLVARANERSMEGEVRLLIRDYLRTQDHLKQAKSQCEENPAVDAEKDCNHHPWPLITSYYPQPSEGVRTTQRDEPDREAL